MWGWTTVYNKASISFVFFFVTLRQMDFCLLFVSQLRMGWLTRRTSLLVCYVLHSRGVSVEHQSFDGLLLWYKLSEGKTNAESCMLKVLCWCYLCATAAALLLRSSLSLH